MVNTLTKPEFDEVRPGVKAPAQETILTPRFYTTDFEAMAQLDVTENQAELEAILAEFRTDYNRHHFVRDEDFEQSWEHIDGETRQMFVEFLERSCTAEFSGFLLYKELSRKLKGKNPILAEGFSLMSRDEARHAGFLNKAMSDFNLSLDLGFLTQVRSYTYFEPEFIFYATYLSEKIGYWRYIKIYRHLEAHPEDRIYPIFKFFENWCQDENRHGDFFDAVMRAQPKMLDRPRSLWQKLKEIPRSFSGKAWSRYLMVSWVPPKLWCRFFLLSVFATMYLNDLQRSKFYAAIGLDAREFDKEVIKETNATAGRVFPIVLDVDHPEFYPRLEACVENNVKLSEIANSQQPGLVKFFRKLPLYAANMGQLLKLFLLPPQEVAVGSVK
ncbi:magnesium-protoporphyrin IX monomethyl ester (oxidative) cyclase [Thermosynechococcaceae cyanobacterium BACA0444]|uniref:Magnesium-protoporphyrin IX monomethyl ester [oxidative] cyclase n=1 Tax=Pseudocalidococcus azoricus BACA0444 TaxID=2918990 RepID=A0AAE4FTZ8_9CYAN|nr:magnesium-protoporphyrin IX monomethyl ester (oxidative) cyclase [Pseudocalidococcus azoricus]MDS3861212.1 magnesium-protoporphyrin IX monomethyl ester (oxidative) cyclase [Pseudocalidococcus azoricus BACA0444]